MTKRDCPYCVIGVAFTFRVVSPTGKIGWRLACEDCSHEIIRREFLGLSDLPDAYLRVQCAIDRAIGGLFADVPEDEA